MNVKKPSSKGKGEKAAVKRKSKAVPTKKTKPPPLKVSKKAEAPIHYGQGVAARMTAADLENLVYGLPTSNAKATKFLEEAKARIDELAMKKNRCRTKCPMGSKCFASCRAKLKEYIAQLSNGADSNAEEDALAYQLSQQTIASTKRLAACQTKLAACEKAKKPPPETSLSMTPSPPAALGEPLISTKQV